MTLVEKIKTLTDEDWENAKEWATAGELEKDSEWYLLTEQQKVMLALDLKYPFDEEVHDEYCEAFGFRKCSYDDDNEVPEIIIDWSKEGIDEEA